MVINKERGNTLDPILGSILIIVMGIIFIGVNYYSRAKCTEIVHAIVIGYSEGSEPAEFGFRRITYAPVFKYEYNDKEYESVSKTYSNNAKNKFNLNSEYDILINPDDPVKFYFDKTDRDWGIAGWCLICMGIAALILNIKSLITEKTEQSGFGI